MEEIVDKFNADFHGLDGVTVAEKKRNLFHLFHKYSSHLENKSIQDSITLQLKAETHLERLFLVEFLIYCRRFDELWQEFLKGDEIIISKISKQKWFFQHAFKETGAEFVTQVLPLLSFSLKLKILKKMPPILDETRGDEIFGALLEHYGISTAANILTSCSVGKVEQVLKNYSVQLWTNQLKLLYDKNPNLIYLYLEEREKHEDGRKFMDYNPIFQYIAERNTEMYCDLYQKYNFKIKLGKRVTKKLIVEKRDEIIAKPELHVKNLNPARLVRKLGQDFKQVYLKLFPTRIQDSPNSESTRLLKYYPKKGQYNLMITTYNQIFHKKLDECPHLIDEYLLNMIVNADEREKLAKLKEGNDPHDVYIKYYRIDHSISAIKERIKFARTPHERAILVGTLVRTCLVNDDYDALLEVSEFVTQRFKNDSKDVQMKLVETLIYYNCNFDKFNEQHWNCINKIVKKPDFPYFENHLFQKMFFQYIEFLCRTDKPIEGEILCFFKGKEFVAGNMERLRRNVLVEKTVLSTIIELAPQLVSAATTIENLDCKLILACKQYNSRNPKYRIKIFSYPRLVASVKNVLINKITVKNNVALAPALEMIICTKQRSDEIEEIIKLYWDNVSDVGTPFGIRWFLKHRPEIIEQYLHSFLTFAISKREVNQDDKIWKVIKTYSHLNTKSVEFCLSKLNEKGFRNPQFVIKPLSLLMRSQEFLALMESYKPASHKVDLQDEGASRRFQIQRNILKESKNIDSPVQVLSLLLQFCSHDYVASCLGPLYSAFYRASENEIKPFLDELNNRGAISVKKHAFYLAGALFGVTTATSALRLCRLNQSVAITFKYFLKNQSDDAWELFSSKIPHLRKNDEATIKLLASRKAPKKYKPRCFEILWKFLYENNKYKSILLKNVHHVTILGLKPETFASLVENQCFVTSAMNSTVSNCLIYRKDEEKLHIIFSYLEKFKSWGRLSKKNLNDFIFAFFTAYVKWEGEDKNLIATFLSKFQQIYPPVRTFEEFVTLTVTSFKNQAPSDFSKSIIELHNNLLLKYGETIVEIFANCLKKLLPYFCKDNSQMYRFYYLLLNAKQSVNDMLLVIKLLPNDAEPEDRESFNYYSNTLTQLEKVDLVSVQLHLNLHFKFHKVCLNYEYYERTNRLCIKTSSWLSYGARRKLGYTYY